MMYIAHMQTSRLVVVVAAFVAGAALNGPASAQATAAAPGTPASETGAASDGTRSAADAEFAADEARRDAEGAEQARIRAEERARLSADKARATRLERLASLDLSDTQKNAIADLPAAQKAWQKAHSAELDSIREGVAAAWAQDDAKTVQRLSAERKRLSATRPSLNRILSREQQKQLRAEQAKTARANRSQRREARPPAPAVTEMRRQIAEAKRAGDVERAAELETKLQQLKRAVREERARARQAAE